MREKTIKAEEWLDRRKWKKFLLAIPLGKSVGYSVDRADDINIIKVRASQLNKDQECDRKFSVTSVKYDRKTITITATLK